MTYLLNTNAWASYLNRRNASVVSGIQQIGSADIRLCSMVKAELYYGANKSPCRDANRALLARRPDER